LKHGAKVDVHDADGNTPLHRAVVGGSPRIVLALQRKGAKAGVKNKNDLTPLACISEDLAEKHKSKITAMLKNAEEQERRSSAWNQSSQNPVTPEKRPSLPTASSSAYSKASRNSLTPSRISLAPITPIAVNRNSASSVVQEPKTATRMPMSPRTASVIYTPPSPKPTQTSFPKTATGSPELPSSSTLSIEKPLPRVDSGIRYTKKDEEENALPVLDRSKKTYGDEMGARDSKEDFQGWLAMSQLLEQ